MTVGAMIPTTDEPAETVDAGTSILRLVALLAAIVALAVFVSWSAVVWVLLLLVSIFLHELGHYLGARRGGMKVTQFFFGFGPRIWSFRRGETEYGVKAIPLGAYVKTPGMTNLEEVDPADEARSYRAQSYGRRFAMVLAGPAMNLLVALVLFCVFFATWSEPDYDAPDQWPAIDAPSPDFPAGKAGLREGDRLVAIDGQSAADFDAFRALVKPRPGDEVQVTVLRDGSELTVPVVLASRTLEDGKVEGVLGIIPLPHQIDRSVPEGIQRGFTEFGSQVKDTGVAIGQIFSPSGIYHLLRMVTGQEEDRPEKRPTSIVGITKYGSQAVQDSTAATVGLLASLNMALGLFNLLPILPLDGGHLLIATYERIRSRRGKRYHVDFARVMPVFAVLTMMVLLVFVSAVYLDSV